MLGIDSGSFERTLLLTPEPLQSPSKAFLPNQRGPDTKLSFVSACPFPCGSAGELSVLSVGLSGGRQGKQCHMCFGFVFQGAPFLVTFGDLEKPEAMVCRLSNNQR